MLKTRVEIRVRAVLETGHKTCVRTRDDNRVKPALRPEVKLVCKSGLNPGFRHKTGFKVLDFRIQEPGDDVFRLR